MAVDRIRYWHRGKAFQCVQLRSVCEREEQSLFWVWLVLVFCCLAHLLTLWLLLYVVWFPAWLKELSSVFKLLLLSWPCWMCKFWGDIFHNNGICSAFSSRVLQATGNKGGSWSLPLHCACWALPGFQFLNLGWLNEALRPGAAPFWATCLSCDHWWWQYWDV